MLPNMLDMELEQVEMRSKSILRYLKYLRNALGVDLTFAKTIFSRIIFYMVLLTTGMGWLGVVNYAWEKRHEFFPVYADTMCAMLQSIISVIKMVILTTIEHNVIELIQIVETNEVLRSLKIFNLELNGKRELSKNIVNILTKSCRDVQRQLRFYTFTTCLICCWYFFSCTFINLNKYADPDSENFEIVLPTSASFTFLFKTYVNSYPAIMLQVIFSGMVVFVAGVGGIAFDGIFIVFSIHCKAMVEILCDLLDKTSSDSFVPSHLRASYLRHCIDFHEHIFRFFKNIDSTFFFISLWQFGLSLLILCMVLFQASVGLEGNLALFIKMLFYLSAAGFEIFLFCYNGQRLTNQSKLLPLAWYNSLWYNENKEFQYYVKMTIFRSNHEFIFSVGGFATMSLETLLVFMQTCGSYFLLLRKVNSK